jgi:hypothetical protein
MMLKNEADEDGDGIHENNRDELIRAEAIKEYQDSIAASQKKDQQDMIELGREVENEREQPREGAKTDNEGWWTWIVRKALE